MAAGSLESTDLTASLNNSGFSIECRSVKTNNLSPCSSRYFPERYSLLTSPSPNASIRSDNS